MMRGVPRPVMAIEARTRFKPMLDGSLSMFNTDYSRAKMLKNGREYPNAPTVKASVV